jgi:hypothetical protein
MRILTELAGWALCALAAQRKNWLDAAVLAALAAGVAVLGA